jgi:hypothetical protein
MRPRALVDGAALAAALAPLAYAALRVGARLLGPEPDPAAMLWTERSSTLDRLSLTLYATALTGSACVAIARKFADKMDSIVLAACALSATALFAQGALAP